MSYIRQTGGRSDTVLCTMQCFLKKPLLHHLFHCRTMAVSLQVFPGRCLYDEPLRLKACGLGPGQEVTLQTTMVDEGDETFTSTGRYRAGNNGELDFSQAPALEGGSFTGIEPEGPLWALEPQKRYRRYLRKYVLTPQPVNFTLYEGHQQQPEKILARVTQERWLMGEGLRRIPVREGRVRGSLFLPPGPGPFPGVIEIQGTGGGLLEYKACLLANKGFAVLALAYYKFDDLPPDMKEFHLEYFEEAVNYMLLHPQIKGPGIGLLGHSKAGDLVLSMASFLKGITATVVVNGPISSIGSALRYKDIFIPETKYDPSKIKYSEDGVADITKIFVNPLEEPHRKCLIPIWKADCKFLFIVGQDDGNFQSEFYARTASNLLEEHGKENPEVVIYPRTGHYIEPPYFPLCKASLHKIVGSPVVWGGESKPHAMAQVDAWKRIQVFFHKYLNQYSLGMSKL